MKPLPIRIGLVALVLVFTPAAHSVVFTTNTYIGPFDTTYDALDIIVSNAVLTVEGPHSFASLRLAGGATLTHPPESNGVPTVSLNLQVAGDLEVEPGASINGIGRGFSLGQGLGFGGQAGFPVSGGGGGHGGYGGLSSSNAPGGASFGSPFQPDAPGGCGGTGFGGFGSAGGGVVRLVASNLVLNGSLTVNGMNATNSRTGGGAGGSIWLRAQTISGNGNLSANGGAGEPIHGGGGGGGRIAVGFTTNLFTGIISAVGGNGWQRGGAGTVLLQTNETTGQLMVDNGGVLGAATAIQLTNEVDLTLQGRGTALVTTLQTVRHFFVRSNSVVTTSETNNATLSLTATGSAVVEKGASLTVTGYGFPANQGIGVGQSSSVVGGGAGHGGYGGSGRSGTAAAFGGTAYGSLTNPITVGSGGRTINNHLGGAGGGAVRLSVAGHLQLDGQIDAAGTAGIGSLGGGASGGSVWLTVGSFSGGGVISADGGSGGPPYGGGGAGGRIALTYNSNSFSGTITASGGGGAVAGGAGTVHLKRNSMSVADLIVNNRGLVGTNTPLDVSANFDLDISGGAALRVALASLSIRSLNVGSNSSLLFGPAGTGSASLLLNVAIYANVAAGGRITGDGLGSPSGAGPGAGLASAAGSTGGGHGGSGGRGAGQTNTLSPGGNIYDSTASPTSPGSGGGSTLQAGGAGGAALRLTVTGDLVVNGQISVNGLGPGTNNAGGGSGGSLWLTLNRFSGSGSITADGGAGHLPFGGGGGGGRIAITWANNTFTGAYSAKGGNGFTAGGAGTIYLKANNRPGPDLIFDNGGVTGTSSFLDVSSINNLVLGSGVNLTSSLPSVSITSNLTIAAQGTWRAGALNLTVGSANIAAGGTLSADHTSTSGQITAPYSSLGSGGGGHAGYGGRGAGTTGGGNYFGSTSNPQQAGSPGGNTPGVPSGSPGGGALRLSILGPLVLNGRISANGFSVSTNNAGGGSGGSVWLTLNQLSGSGSISANGGSGHLPNGGGGSGGRVAIYYNSNAFTGDIAARGGNGFGPGAAGTIYLKANNLPAPHLTVDNGGLVGTNTVLSVFQLLNFTIGSGASVTSSAVNLAVTINSNLTINPNAAWRARGGLNLTVGAAHIDTGGILTVDSISSQSPGNGQSSPNGSAGGGHGGYGGRGAGTPGGGNVYDPTSTPTQAGSSGGLIGTGTAAAGGGSLRLIVSGPLVLNGNIAANGFQSATNNGGGGSGGSLWLSLNQFSGTGGISADGGSGHLPNGGGGGGGRVAIYWNTNTFTGSLSAKGGNGFQAGGAGTIYLKPNNQPGPNVIADNGGWLGANTFMDVVTISNLTIAGAARLQPPIGNLFVGNLIIASNSVLFGDVSRSGGLTLNISSTAHIAAGGRISADGLSVFIMGNGSAGTPGSGGGGHGGFGGRGAGTGLIGGPSSGGNAFGSLANPSSGGGNGGGQLSGGIGGGTIRITATGPFLLDGMISAHGLGTSTNGSGGGAGGSVWLTFNELIGAGTIAADGGSGHLPNGGGGGGGRISLSYNFLKGNFPTNGFTGAISAKGGGGYVKGGAGTIYVRTNNASVPNVFVDNGGLRGTNTLVTPTTAVGFDLHVQGGAVVTSPGNPRDVFVRSNSWVHAGLTVSRNATLDAGGGIDLDGQGTSTVGTGSSFSGPKGGGSHGGYGGQNPSGAGNAYDLVGSPTQTGSAGGNGSGTTAAPLGGKGGGATHLTVGNTLTLNGEISANGAAGELNSGGGSGGSVWIQTATLAGNGLITATGADGNGPAGGGGGGRVAVYYSTNLFTGLLSTCGGAGGMFGGAGTIYLRDNVSGITSLVLDNCGNWGANTPLSLSIGLATNLTVTGSAVAEMQGTIPLLSNVVVSAGGEITSGPNEPDLFLSVLGNLTVTEDARIVTDAKGFPRDNGPGYGGALNGQGAGGSHGGWGGDSASGAFGGMINGSATHPVERGSGGGSGSGYPDAGSAGGGAVRLVVAGTVELNGLISANGETGWQDDAGGGSGGSVWISTRKFTGDGTLAAMGGDADFFGGGGGGGGRIAVYSPTNTFTGLVSVIGGDGANFGGAGTIFTSGSLSGMDVVAQTPTGIVSNIVSQVALEFTEPINLASVAASEVRVYTPNGLLPDATKSFSTPTPSMLLVSFNPQNVPGNYRVEVGPLIEGLLAPRMSQVYTGAFSITLPIISGTVTNLNGLPVAGVTLLPTGGLMGAITDAGGNYSLGLPPGWNVSVTPVLGTNAFVPGQLNYTNVSASLAGQDYLMVPTIAPTLSSTVSGAGLSLNWSGLPGVTYQLESSTNLVDWLPYGPPLPGTIGPMQLLVPTSGDPLMFVRLRVAN